MRQEKVICEGCRIIYYNLHDKMQNFLVYAYRICNRGHLSKKILTLLPRLQIAYHNFKHAS